MVGSGTAWISTNGRTIKGTWKKTGVTKPTQFYDASGKAVTLTVGQTFVQVMPAGLPAVVQGRLGPAAGHAACHRPRPAERRRRARLGTRRRSTTASRLIPTSA